MSVPYIDGSGALRQRKTISGDGTTGDPDNFTFADQGAYDRLGETTDLPITTPTAAGTLASVIRGLWQNMLGANADDASVTGSIHAKLRNLSAIIGANADDASVTGSIHAKLRSLGITGDTAARSGSLFAMVRTLAEANFVELLTPSTIAISTSLTTLITFDCRGKKTLGVQLQNTGTTALSGLSVQVKFNSSLGTWNTVASLDADFTTANGKQSNNSSTEIISSGVSSGAIATLAGGETGWFRMHCEGMESVRIQAVVASGSTTMLAHGIAEN